MSISVATRDAKCPFGISPLATDADCCIAAPQSPTEQFLRQTRPFVVLPKFAAKKKAGRTQRGAVKGLIPKGHLPTPYGNQHAQLSLEISGIA